MASHANSTDSMNSSNSSNESTSTNAVTPSPPAPSLIVDGKVVFQDYHNVRGTKRHGFIVDPGAASGIAGTDTKLQYDAAQVPYFDDCDVIKNSNSYSGIDGEPVKSLGDAESVGDAEAAQTG